MFLRKSTDALDLLTEAKLERRFRAAAKDLARLYAGYYVAEFLLDFTHDDDPDPELFDTVHAAIRSLDDSAHVPTTIMRFEIEALQRLGHWPSLRFCASCGEETPATPRIAFGTIAGGTLCAKCRPRHRSVISLSRAAWEALIREEDQIDRPERIEGPTRGELRGLLNQYVCHLLGHRPKMHAFFGMLMQ